MIETESGRSKPEVDTDIKQAIRRFKENGYHAFEYDGTVYIELPTPKADVDFTVQVSAGEVSFRADEYRFWLEDDDEQ